jgi:hypothetical protein
MNKASKLQLQQGDLPNGTRCALGKMIPNAFTNFPTDRAHQDAKNRRELLTKKHQVMRRTVVMVAALGEEMEVEYGT